MQQQYSHTSDPTLASIEKQRCPKCGERMSLARIARGRSAFAIRTLKCTGCHHIHVAIAEADPMKSNAVLWLASHDLKSPT
jgi:ssDNA-binding Zn-finger/Zn-ribbon topoisomerase 1